MNCISFVFFNFSLCIVDFNCELIFAHLLEVTLNNIPHFAIFIPSEAESAAIEPPSVEITIMLIASTICIDVEI